MKVGTHSLHHKTIIIPLSLHNNIIISYVCTLCILHIQDTLCDVWWFPGTNDPNKPCYGYWNAKDDETTPMRFFGLSSLGPTILDYFDFKPGTIPPGIVKECLVLNNHRMI